MDGNDDERTALVLVRHRTISQRSYNIGPLSHRVHLTNLHPGDIDIGIICLI